MGSQTEIAWTDATWSPVVGCTAASPGCSNCYAREMHERRHKAYRAGAKMPAQYAKPFSMVQIFEDRLQIPSRWKKPRRIFVCSQSDLFHPDVPLEFILRVFSTMASTPRHTYQVLTKRPERMLEFCRTYGIGSGNRWPSNVWAGVTTEDQTGANERVPLLLQIPAAVRFVSYEPGIGPVDFRHLRSPLMLDALKPSISGHHDDINNPRHIDWVIIGGESGSKARPFDLEWGRSIIAQCKAAGVSCFVKQMGRRPNERAENVHTIGANGPKDTDNLLDLMTNPPPPRGWTRINDIPSGTSWLQRHPKFRSLDGRDPSEWPEDLRVRQWPSRNG
jgi:protein gp37